MTTVTEAEIAWDLLDGHRKCLTVAERHAVAINLAIGEYQSAVFGILTAVVRENGALTESSVRGVAELIRVYECGPAFRELLDEATTLVDATQTRPYGD